MMRSKGKAIVEVDQGMVAKQIGAQIRHLRLKKSFTQRMLGNLIGTTFQQIQKYENGQVFLTVPRLFQICAALDTSFEITVVDACMLSDKAGPDINSRKILISVL